MLRHTTRFHEFDGERQLDDAKWTFQGPGLRGLGPKGAQGAHYVGIARQFYEGVDNLLCFMI